MRIRARTVAVIAAGAATLVTGPGMTARAQVPLPVLPTTTTTTKPPGSSTTTTSSTLLPGETTTTTRRSTTTEPPTSTTHPGGGGEPGTTSTVPPAPGDEPGGGGGDAAVPDAPPPTLLPGAPGVPPDAAALMAAVVRTGPSNTRKLLDTLQALEDFGLTPQEAAIVGMGRFPVGGYASYVHDWLYPRYVPTFHLHQGTDIFAARGTPVRAPANGVVKITNGSIGGLAVYVTEPSGTYWYMAHLSGVKEGLAAGQTVKVGDVVGYIGDSGNAKGGATHCHFEIHPNGGPAIDPKPVLDQFLADAIANVPKLVRLYEQKQPRGLVATGLVRRLLDAGTEGLAAAPASPSRSQLLWASSANPAGGALRLAEAEAAQAALDVDWEARAQREHDAETAWNAGDLRARRLLAPLSTAAIAAAMDSGSGDS
jgi:murein DD-endopeptidase MepM/ murein hydrolase activator NlpD